ncbi:cadherin-like domain-containing protein, partial [Vibrio tapetis subsp. quintayensis]|uniref:cadherin-like domain-containing protein n=1 Tax=Vibrio tapetis TaxID=52443 RepID=UPI0025B61026
DITSGEVVIDTTAPSVPVVVITEDTNNDGLISETELDGDVNVTISLSGTGALKGDTLTVNGTPITLTQNHIDAGKVLTTVDAPAEGARLTVDATITDAAGNVSEKGTDSAKLDTKVSAEIDILHIAGDNKINGTESNANISVVGFVNKDAKPGDNIDFYLEGELIGSVEVSNEPYLNSNGEQAGYKYEFTTLGSNLIPDGEVDGVGQLIAKVTVIDEAGNTHVASNHESYFFDLVAPDAPSITNITDDSVDSDYSTVTLHGTGSEPGNTIEVFAKDASGLYVSIGTALVVAGSPSPTWTLDISSESAIPLNDNEFLYAKETDSYGNTSEASDTVHYYHGDFDPAQSEASDDYVLLGTGDDEFIVNKDDENDKLVADGGAGIDTAKFDFAKDAQGVTVTINASGEVVVVDPQGDTNTFREFEKFDFDGEVISKDEILKPEVNIIDADNILTQVELGHNVNYTVKLPVGAAVGSTLVLTIEGVAQTPIQITQQHLNNGQLNLSLPGSDVVGSELTIGAQVTLENGQTGESGSDSIDVNAAPNAEDDSLNNIDEETIVTIAKSDLVVNDSDADSDSFSITNVGNAVGGTVAIIGSNVVFTPTEHFNGKASFTYTITDAHGDIDTATVEFTYDAVNDQATITGIDVGSVTEVDGSVILSDTGTLYSTDVDNVNNLFQTIVSDVVHPTEGAPHGSLTMTEAGVWTYNVNNSQIESLALNQTRVESFIVKSADDTTHQIDVTITGTNDEPTVSGPVTKTVAEDSSSTVDLLQNASDVDNGHSLSIVDLGALPDGVIVSGSTLTIDTSHASYQHLGKDDSMDVTVNYKVKDENGATVDQSAVITVTGTNDDPVAQNFKLTTDSDGDVEFKFTDVDLNLVTQDSAVSDVEDDHDGTTLKIVIDEDPLFGDFYIAGTNQKVAQGSEIDADTKLEYRAADDANDKLSFDAVDYINAGNSVDSSVKTIVIGGVSISGGVYSGDMEKVVSLTKESLGYDSEYKDRGFGVNSVGDVDNEISSSAQEYMQINFADGVTVTSADISFASMHGHYDKDATQNAQVNIYLYRDGKHVETLVVDADKGDTLSNSLATKTIEFEDGFDEIRVTTTANSNSNFTVRGVEVNESTISESIDYHAVDADGADSNTAQITVDGTTSDAKPDVSVQIGEPLIVKASELAEHNGARRFDSLTSARQEYSTSGKLINEGDHRQDSLWHENKDADYLMIAHGGNNEILTAQHGDFNDILIGGDGVLGNPDKDKQDSLYARGGDDILIGEGGDDGLYGGSGKDTAVYAGNFDEYDVSDVKTTSGNSKFFTVEDEGHEDAGRSDEGDDDLYDIEYLQFADGLYHWNGSEWENLDEQTYLEYPLDIDASVGDIASDIIHSLTIEGLPSGSEVVNSSGDVVGSLNSDGTWSVPVTSGQTEISIDGLSVRIPQGEQLSINVKVEAIDSGNNDIESSEASATAPHEVFVAQEDTPPTLISLVLDSSGSMDDYSHNGVTRMNLMLKASVAMLADVKDQPGSSAVHVQLIDFDNRVSGSSNEENMSPIGWFTVDEAIAILTSAQNGSVEVDGTKYFQVQGGTDYEEAAYATINGYDSLPTGIDASNTNDVVYFISDGESNGGWDGDAEKAWDNFTKGKDVTAVGIVQSVTSETSIEHLEDISNKVVYIPDSELTTKLPQLAPTIGQSGDLLGADSTSKVVIDADKLDVIQFIAEDGSVTTPAISATEVNGDLKITTDYGELFISEDGSYVFEPSSTATDVNTGKAVGFEVLYTLVDAQGSESQRLMSLNIHSDGETVLAQSHAQVGSTANDTLVGTGFDDILLGGDGEDILTGGLGNDILTGGDDADIFKWVAGDLDGSTDRITDFSISEGDKVDLSDLFTDTPTQQQVTELLDNIKVDGDADNSSMIVEKTGQQVTIEFDGLSAADLTNNLSNILVIKED